MTCKWYSSLHSLQDLGQRTHLCVYMKYSYEAEYIKAVIALLSVQVRVCHQMTLDTKLMKAFSVSRVSWLRRGRPCNLSGRQSDNVC